MEKSEKRKIQVIVPITDTKFNEKMKKEIGSVKAPDFEISLVNIVRGTPFIESRYGEFLDTGEIIRLSLEAQKNGFDGIYINCFGEPGVPTVRELVDIPVLGGFEPAVMTANLISQRFSIITVLKRVVPMLRTLARNMGITDNIASIRNVNIPVDKLDDEELLKAKLLEESRKAIQKDGAEAIVLGCTAMLEATRTIQKELKELGLPAPVIEPTMAAVSFLQSLIRNGLAQSRLTYFKSNAG